jgi:hypothetical protein
VNSCSKSRHANRIKISRKAVVFFEYLISLNFNNFGLDESGYISTSLTGSFCALSEINAVNLDDAI